MQLLVVGWLVHFCLKGSEGIHVPQVQDTIAICPAVASQKAALAALDAGRQWVPEP